MVSSVDFLSGVTAADFSLGRVQSIGTLTLQGIGFHKELVEPTFAISEPFPLFTERAIDGMRRELLISPLEDPARLIDGIVEYQETPLPNHCHYTRNAWMDSKTSWYLSSIARVNIQPIIHQIRVKVFHKGEATKTRDLTVAERKDKERNISWHTDAYPFTCILMMTDTSKMQGGENVINTPDGPLVMKLPPKGWAFIVRGDCVEHAVRIFSQSSERITTMASFEIVYPREF